MLSKILGFLESKKGHMMWMITMIVCFVLNVWLIMSGLLSGAFLALAWGMALYCSVFGMYHAYKYENTE